MMRSEPRKDDPSINIVTWSGISTGEDKVEGKQLVSDIWFWRADEKNVGFCLHREKEKFMVVRLFFMDLGASMSKNQMLLVPWKEKPKELNVMQDLDPTMLK